jgi:tRNA 5-methylaminomethyl-2-thiouridine biosynthesis bifunctional protein
MSAQQDALALLRGHGLPARWAGRAQFVVLQTGFGLGHHFLAAWDAWRQDAARCERLFCIVLEPRPIGAEELVRAHEGTPLAGLAQTLAQAWPPLTPNLHKLGFEQGRVQLLLALGDVASTLRKLRLFADAFCLGEHAPGGGASEQVHIVKGLAALAAPGATLASLHSDEGLHQVLISAGFVPRAAAADQPRAQITLADWAPRHSPRRPPSTAMTERQAVVVGAGLAGAAAAQALAQAGWQVTVLERHAAAAQEASGNTAGLFHGTVNADDGPYARLFRAAALHAQRVYRAAIEQGVPGAADGLLRLDARAGGLPAMQAMVRRCGLPSGYVQLFSDERASAAAGLALPAPAWFYPGGGWVAPAAWVTHALLTPGVRLVTGADVHTMQREAEAWVLRGAGGDVLATAATVVLANAASAQTLLAPLGHRGWPLRHTRGQVTQFDVAHSLRLPVAGDGYAIPLPGAVLCGATREAGEPGDTALSEEDHRHNLQRLHRLTGLQAPADAALWQGRTGWRLHSDDRLPIAGAVPLAQMPAMRGGQRLDQARLLPRERGLFVLTALGARGITLAPLLAQLVAAMASGTPWPLEQDLADAVDPGRWLVRAARHAGAGGGAQSGVQSRIQPVVLPG